MKIDTRAIEEIRSYALRENKLTCEGFMEFLEKGNEDLVRIEKLIGELDRKLTQMVKHN